MNEAQYFEAILNHCRVTIGLIDMITQRGGVKGEELSTVGNLRDNATKLIALTEQKQSDMAEDAE